MKTPQPVETIVCSVCKQPWTDHMTTSRRRWRNEHSEPHEPFTFTPDNVPVTMEDCIFALQAANAGPPGPVGATGADGICTHGYSNA